MKLHHFSVSKEAERLQQLGKALAEPETPTAVQAVLPVAEATKSSTKKVDDKDADEKMREFAVKQLADSSVAHHNIAHHKIKHYD